MPANEATAAARPRPQRSMTTVLGVRPPPATDGVFLAPKSINPARTEEVEVTEFKIAGKLYIRCKDLTSTPGAGRGRLRTSHCWKWGEDIQRKDRTPGQPAFYYCYLCERSNKKQELPVVSSGRSTALEHLVRQHRMDKATGNSIERRQAVVEAPPGQLMLQNVEEHRSLDMATNFATLKRLLVRWIVCCHVAFFQFENMFFRAILNFLYPGLERFLPRARATIRKWVAESRAAEDAYYTGRDVEEAQERAQAEAEAVLEGPLQDGDDDDDDDD